MGLKLGPASSCDGTHLAFRPSAGRSQTGKSFARREQREVPARSPVASGALIGLRRRGEDLVQGPSTTVGAPDRLAQPERSEASRCATNRAASNRSVANGAGRSRGASLTTRPVNRRRTRLRRSGEFGPYISRLSFTRFFLLQRCGSPEVGTDNRGSAGSGIENWASSHACWRFSFCHCRGCIQCGKNWHPD